MIKALIVDDQSLFLDSLELFLRQDDSIEVIGTATNGTDALAVIRKCEPDILLLDLRMPGISGLDVARMVRTEFPGIKIIILTTFDDNSDILQTIVLGCEGYILKDIKPADLVLTVKCVYDGLVVMHPAAYAAIKQSIKNDPTLAVTLGLRCSLDSLNAEERCIVALLSNGMSNKEIASELGHTEGTIKNYISRILQKTGCRDRTHLAIQSLKQGAV